MSNINRTYQVQNTNTKVKKHPFATNEASDGKRLPRRAAATGRLFLPATVRRLFFLGPLGWAGAAPKPHAGSSDGDTAIELLSEVVPWLMLVWFVGQTEIKN